MFHDFMNGFMIFVKYIIVHKIAKYKILWDNNIFEIFSDSWYKIFSMLFSPISLSVSYSAKVCNFWTLLILI